MSELEQFAIACTACGGSPTVKGAVARRLSPPRRSGYRHRRPNPYIKLKTALVSPPEGELCLHSSAALITAIGGAFGLLAVMALLATCVITLATNIILAASALIFGTAPRALASLLFKYGMRNFKRHSP